MNKTRKMHKRKPFKTKVKGKRLTIMLIPSSTAKVKSMSIPYSALWLILAPFLCIAVIVLVYQNMLTDLREHANSNESQARDYSSQYSEVTDEKSRLEQTLAATEALLIQSESEAEAIRSRLDDFDSTMARFLARVEDIEKSKQNILDVFAELQQTQGLDIPYTFDEGVLTRSSENAVGGAYISSADANEIFAGLDVFLTGSAKDYTELEKFAGQLSAYFRARPAGLPIPGGTFRDGYGYRVSPVTGETEMHTGIDIAGETGDEVQATADGVVSFSGWNDAGFGNLVIINHAYGYSTLYGHNSENIVREGEEVKRGQAIGYVGETGDATGLHTHYEVRRNGIQQDPRLYIRD